MSFDSLKSSVTEYREKKQELSKERRFFDSERSKVDSLSAVTSHLDISIVDAIQGIQDAFAVERDGLDQQADNLQHENVELIKRINDEQIKLNTVQRKIDSLTGKKHVGVFEEVSQKCDSLLAELDEMLKEVDSEGDISVGGGVKIEHTENHSDNRRDTKSNGTDSFLLKLFSKNQSDPNGPKFGNFDLAPIKNGSDFFVKGTSYDQFIRDYYNSEQSIYESLGNNEVIAIVSPGNIEGIHLGKTEVADGSIFWSQHESGGTRESFVAIASNIPEVEKLLQAGLSLEEIRENPSLERCVNIYFDPSNIPRVIQSHGYYEFDSNGRHRILAAREVGYNIPVKIVGIRRRNERSKQDYG